MWVRQGVRAVRSASASYIMLGSTTRRMCTILDSSGAACRLPPAACLCTKCICTSMEYYVLVLFSTCVHDVVHVLRYIVRGTSYFYIRKV